MVKRNRGHVAMAAYLLLVLCAFLPADGRAHCDTLTGPVVTSARAALEKGEVTPVLKWVKPEGEAEIRDAFKKAMAVRAAGGEARDLADRWFFETLVRVHRAGEGAPYTGLKDVPEEPIIRMADRSLAAGNVDDLIAKLNQHTAAKVRALFKKALEARKDEDRSVAAGREAVEAYVIYVHYLENLHAAIAGGDAHAGAH